MAVRIYKYLYNFPVYVFLISEPWSKWKKKHFWHEIMNLINVYYNWKRVTQDTVICTCIFACVSRKWHLYLESDKMHNFDLWESNFLTDMDEIFADNFFLGKNISYVNLIWNSINCPLWRNIEDDIIWSGFLFESDTIWHSI